MCFPVMCFNGVAAHEEVNSPEIVICVRGYHISRCHSDMCIPVHITNDMGFPSNMAVIEMCTPPPPPRPPDPSKQE